MVAMRMMEYIQDNIQEQNVVASSKEQVSLDLALGKEAGSINNVRVKDPPGFSYCFIADFSILLGNLGSETVVFNLNKDELGRELSE